MRTISTPGSHRLAPAAARRGRVLAALLALALATGACNDFLRVENPGAIQAPQLEDPKYINLMVNGVIGEFQPTFATVAYYDGLFTDELRNQHVYFEEGLFDQRRVEPENGTYSFFYYNPLHRARFLADSVAGRLTTLLGDSASRDLRLARVRAYGGYAYVLLGEAVCESPVNMSAPYSSQQLLDQFAIPRFDEAIAVARAARAAAAAVSPATPASLATVAGADSIENFARVGAARANLFLGNLAAAAEYADSVPPGFEFRAYYSENSSRENNPFWGRFSAGSANTSASLAYTPFDSMVDPRVPRPATPERTMNGVTAYVPNSPSAFNTYDSTIVGADFTLSGWLRIASGLEAQYIVAEASGPTPEAIAFVESRRQIAPDSTQPTTPENFLANLRDQRRRDLYLDTHRLGDLRRYKANYGVDEFQSGPYPGSTTGEIYGDQTCLPLTLGEINGNPNVPK